MDYISGGTLKAFLESYIKREIKAIEEAKKAQKIDDKQSSTFNYAYQMGISAGLCFVIEDLESILGAEDDE